MRGLVTPSLKMKRALVRRTGIPLRRFRASCEVENHWDDLGRIRPLYRWDTPDTRGGKSWVGRAFRVTLELRDPKPAFGPEPIVNRGRMRRGTRVVFATGEAPKLVDAVSMALILLDDAMGVGWTAVEMKPTPQQVVNAINRFQAPLSPFEPPYQPGYGHHFGQELRERLMWLMPDIGTRENIENVVRDELHRMGVETSRVDVQYQHGMGQLNISVEVSEPSSWQARDVEGFTGRTIREQVSAGVEVMVTVHQ